MVLVLAACGPASTGDGSGDGTMSEATGSSSGMVEPGGTSVTSAGPDMDSTSGTTETGTPDDDDGGSSTGAPFDPFAGCEEPPLVLEVASFGTPDGPLQVDWASMGLAGCTWGLYVSFVAPAFEGSPAREVTVLIAPDDGPGVLQGEYPATLPFEGDVAGTATLIDPFEVPSEPVDEPQGHVHAQIEIHEGGWDISAEVDVVHCGAFQCFCPCR